MKTIENIGFYIALYGIAIVLIWIGVFKFTPTEADGIKSLVENSPFMAWSYKVASVMNVSRIIGTLEIITGVMLILFPFSAWMGLVGGVLSTFTFAITLSFLATTPNIIVKVDGIWLPDAFILKDIMAFGFSIYVAAISAQKLGLFVRQKIY
ncbi:MAG: DUF417 family protein [Cytophagales bacterium]